MKQHLLYRTFLLVLLLTPTCLFSQGYKFPNFVAEENPFARKSELRGNSELYLVYDTTGTTGFTPYQRVFDFIPQATPAQCWLPKQLYTAGPQIQGNRHIGMATGDFNGDFKDDIVQAWESTAQGIIVTIPNIPLNLNVNGYTQTTIAAGLSTLNTGTPSYVGRIRIATGDFDGDLKSEFVIAYRNTADGKIHLDFFDIDSATMNMTLTASIADESLPLTSSTPHECFDIAARDMDADGISEVVLASAQTAANSKYRIYNKVYHSNGINGFTITAKAKQTIDSLNVSSFERLNISVGIGDFNDDIAAEIITAYGFQGNSSTDSWIRITRPADDTLTNPGTPDWFEALILQPSFYSTAYSINNLETFCVATGDLNMNGSDEIIVGLSDQFRAYKVDSLFNITPLGSSVGIAQNYTDRSFDSYLTVGDVNSDGKADVLNVRNSVTFGPPDEQELYIRAHVYDTTTNSFILLADLSGVYTNTFSNTNAVRSFAVAAGDFDGDRIRFRTGRKYDIQNVIQPLVTLNAPPVHFDYVTDNAPAPVDVCGCFPTPGANCPFYARYIQTSQNQQTLETQLNSDWSVSASLSVGGSYGVLSAKADLETTYGEKFSKTNKSTVSLSTVSGSSAYYDDQYYATVTTYTVWEYPIYVGDTLIGYAASFVPKSTDNLWVSASAELGVDYPTKHEPGNILSYRTTGTVKDIQDSILGNNGWNISQTLGPQNLGITFSNFTSSSASNTQTLNLKASASVGVFGQSVGIAGTYSYENIRTQTVTAQNDIELMSYVNSRTGSGGDYNIIPYFGWGRDGSLTLDYQVNPTSQWWSQNYGTPDPALLLPWRWYTDMGFTLPSPAFVNRTKSIFLSDRNPRTGDTLSIIARIFNYSTSDLNNPVDVSFYYGDPSNGGVLIQNLQGQTVVPTSSLIEAQGYDSLNFHFVMQPPANLTDRRFFVVIDPANSITESHESNNKGWIGMGIYFPVGVNELSGNTNSWFTAWPAWPNPANSQTNVRVEMHKPGKLQLEIFDMQGKLVKTITNMQLNAGEYTFPIITSDLQNGIYFVRSATKDVAGTQKLVVLH